MRERQLDYHYIDCYLTLLVKGLTNISIENGSVDCKFTLIIRFDKRNLKNEILLDLKRNGLLLRVNDEPLSIDSEYRNKVVKENRNLYIITIRDKIKIDFYEELLVTPFDKFQIVFKVDLTSKVMQNLAYSFNCLINLIDERSNLTIKKEANMIAGFYIDHKNSKTFIDNEFKKDRRGLKIDDQRK